MIKDLCNFYEQNFHRNCQHHLNYINSNLKLQIIQILDRPIFIQIKKAKLQHMLDQLEFPLTNPSSQGYFSNFLQKRVPSHNQYNIYRQRPEENQEEEGDFTPFMKRHSSSGDSYIREEDYRSRREEQQDDINARYEDNENGQSSFTIDKKNIFSKRYEHEDQINEEIKENTKLDDSFLQLVDQHLSHIQKDKENIIRESNLIEPSTLYESITISKTQISHALLQNQQIIDSIQLTNLLPVKSIAKLINSPFQFRLINAKNKFIKKDQVQIELQPYETIEIEFQIKKRQAQIGNIYETMKIQTFGARGLEDTDKKTQIHEKYLKFEITFVKPKLQVTFLGRIIVKRIQEHKIAHFQIFPNELNQYFINLIFTQEQFSTLNCSKLHRIQCQIQAKGYISVHPNSVILYQNEPLKIVIRKLSQLSGAGKTSVILIKPLHSSLVYVIAVKCMDKKAQDTQQDNFKMSKFQF